MRFHLPDIRPNQYPVQPYKQCRSEALNIEIEKVLFTSLSFGQRKWTNIEAFLEFLWRKTFVFFIGSNLKTYLVSQFVCVTCGSKSRLLKKMDPGANSLTHRRAETGRGCRSSSSVGGGFFSGRIKCLERQFNQLKSTGSTGKSDFIMELRLETYHKKLLI